MPLYEVTFSCVSYQQATVEVYAKGEEEAREKAGAEVTPTDWEELDADHHETSVEKISDDDDDDDEEDGD
jgi:hypothetical protein